MFLACSLPFRISLLCCLSHVPFFLCCSLSLSSASPGLFAYPAGVVVSASFLFESPLLSVFASPYENCLHVCRLSSSSFCFTSPLCADAAPCSALDLSSTDNHRDNVEGRNFSALMAKLLPRLVGAVRPDSEQRCRRQQPRLH